MCGSLNLPVLPSAGASAVNDLAIHCREQGCARAWIGFVEDEGQYLMALARRIAEERREARKEQADHV